MDQRTAAPPLYENHYPLGALKDIFADWTI